MSVPANNLSLSFLALIQRISKIANHAVLLFNRLILFVNRLNHILIKIECTSKGKTENENYKNGCFHAYPLLKSILSLHIAKVKIILTCLILSAGMALFLLIYGWLIDRVGMFGRM
jgi:hypothetical protein